MEEKNKMIDVQSHSTNFPEREGKVYPVRTLQELLKSERPKKIVLVSDSKVVNSLDSNDKHSRLLWNDSAHNCFETGGYNPH